MTLDRKVRLAPKVARAAAGRPARCRRLLVIVSSRAARRGSRHAITFGNGYPTGRGPFVVARVHRSAPERLRGMWFLQDWNSDGRIGNGSGRVGPTTVQDATEGRLGRRILDTSGL